MADRETLKRLALEGVEAHKEQALALARRALSHPEVGFTEEKTSRAVREALEALGIPCTAGLALTGLKGVVEMGGGPGPTVALLAELDAIRVPGHPYADPTTGAAHACGHHAQLGMVLGALAGLLRPEVRSALAGRVAVLVVPAEEFIDVAFRHRLREEGKVHFLSGKQEFIRLGALNDVDLAMMCHTTSHLGEKAFAVGGTSNGHLVKWVRYEGRSAHAGGAPWNGINALNAAMLGLMAIHANRETFRDEEHIRVHGILTRGGSAVSAVPDEVTLEWRVRGASLEGIEDAERKVDRAFKAGALGVGATVRITTLAGYLPMRNDPALQEVFYRNACALVGPERVVVHPPDHNPGSSTDMGDVSHLLPAIHPYVGGAVGTGHGTDYLVQDWDLAVLMPARAMAMTVVDLLAEGARTAREVVERHRPALTRSAYLNLQESRFRTEVFHGHQAV